MNRSRLPCPHPSCSSSDAFSYETEKMVGKCHSCNQPYPAKGIRYEEHWLEEYPLATLYTGDGKETTFVLDSVQTKVYRSLRGISENSMKVYDVKTVVDHDGHEVSQEYVYPSGGTKVRTLPKSFRTTSGFKPDELFGMDKFNAGCAQSVTITEGELDALSAYQMLGSKYPVVSLPSATPSAKLYEKCKDWLGSFDKIYLSFDSDGKSDPVATKLVNLFPNRIYLVPHDRYKDANEFLQAGAAADYKNCWYNARKYVPDNVFNSTEDFLKIYRADDDSSYLPTGIQAFDDVALGLMQGHLTVFQAPEGIGKTEFMRFLEYGILSRHPDVPIAICHMEETKKRSLLGLASYKLKDNVTRKDLIDAKENNSKVEEAIISLTKDEKLYQFTLGVDDDPLDLLDKIRYFAEACQCKYVFFEPIQDLGYSRQTDETLEAFLSGLSTKLSRLASELNVGIVTVAHENDDGAIRDCRMIGKRASVVVKLSRDKMHSDPEKRDTTQLLLTKNRPASSTGTAGYLRFNPDTFTLEEAYGDV